MAAKKQKERLKARSLRAQGLSIQQIANQLNVSKSSVSNWVRDVELTDTQRHALHARQKGQKAGSEANRKRAQKDRLNQQMIGRQHAHQGSQLHLQGCMLYWAEGAKRRGRIHFVNSDVHMMQLFMRFLREELDVTDDQLHLFLHLHTDDPVKVEQAQRFWLSKLSLTDDNMRSVHVKAGSQSRKNILEHGIATICVYSTDLVMQIYGAIQEYGGFDNPEWLF